MYGYSKFFKNGFNNHFIIINEIIPVRTIMITFKVQSLRTSPSAKLAAGGCSVLVTTITNIVKPTASAPNITYENSCKNEILVSIGSKDK